MVKKLNAHQKQAFTQAITEAEQATAAEIVVVVAPASDAYVSYVHLYGLIAGSGIATGLWAGKIFTTFPLLLAIQVGIMAALSLTPFLRSMCQRFVPERIRHHRAAHRAFEEYLSVSRHVPASAPILLLYISLAERYAHILPSRSVREKIPDKEWDTVIAAFTTDIKSDGLESASVHAIRTMAKLLAPHFPPHGESHHRIRNDVIAL